jgi:hypothetical protein
MKASIYYSWSEMCLIGITHWLPLPRPPLSAGITKPEFVLHSSSESWCNTETVLTTSESVDSARRNIPEDSHLCPYLYWRVDVLEHLAGYYPDSGFVVSLSLSMRMPVWKTNHSCQLNAFKMWKYDVLRNSEVKTNRTQTTLLLFPEFKVDSFSAKLMKMTTKLGP